MRKAANVPSNNDFRRITQRTWSNSEQHYCKPENNKQSCPRFCLSDMAAQARCTSGSWNGSEVFLAPWRSPICSMSAVSAGSERGRQAIELELRVDLRSRGYHVNGSEAVDIRYRRAPFSDDSFG
jgi:hypothetical protein